MRLLRVARSGEIDGKLTASGADAWRRVHEAIMAGLLHDLNGRVAALDGLTRVASLEGSLDSSLMSLLLKEVEKLADTARQLRQLPRKSRGEVEGVTLREAAEEAIQLLGNDEQFLGIELSLRATESVAVIARPNQLLETLLLLLASLRPTRSGWAHKSTLVIDWATSDGSVTINVSAPPDFELDSDIADATESAARELNGALLRERVSEKILSLRIPTLQG